MSFKSVTKNAAWLGVVQGLNYLVPLLTLTIVSRALGAELFGVYSLAMAYAAYVGLMVEYGFNWTATREAARARDNRVQLATLYQQVQLGKLILTAPSVIAYVLIVFSTGFVSEHKIIYELVLVQIIFTSLSPNWFYLGMERMRELAFIQIFARSISLILIVLMVKHPGDIVLYAFINSITAFVIFFVMRRKVVGELGHVKPDFHASLGMLRETFPIFGSTVAINIYTTTNVVIIGILLGPVAAGYYALADKIRSAFMGVYGPISQALYPYICRVTAEGEGIESQRVKIRFFKWILVLALCLTILMFLFSSGLVQLVGGGAFEGSVVVLQWMAFLPVIVVLSNIFGVQTMLPNGMHREFSLILVLAAIIGIAVFAFATYIFGLKGSGAALLFVEGIVTLLMGIVLYRRNRFPFLVSKGVRINEI